MRKSSLSVAVSLAALVLLEFISFEVNGISGARGDLLLKHILPYFAIFCLSATLYKCFSATFERVVAVVLSVWLSYEAVLGIMQLAGLRMSFHRLFRMTGSFGNPGPYGGFLAVCVTVCLTSFWKFRRSSGKADKLLSPVCLFSSVLGLVVLPATLSRSAWAAIAAAALFFLLSQDRLRCWLRGHKWIAAAIAALCVALAPAGVFLKKGSALGRVHIWRIETRSICKNPLIGYGPGNAMGAYGEAQADFFYERERSEDEIRTAGCPEYPFNEYLRFGLETGLGGLLLSGMVAAGAVAALLKARSPLSFGLLALSVFAFASYPLSVSQLAALLSVFLGCAVSSDECTANWTRPKAVLYAVAVSALVGVLAFGLYGESRISGAEKRWKDAKAVAERLRPQSLSRSLGREYNLLCDNYRYLYDYGYSLFLAEEYEKGIGVLQEGAAMSCDPMFWNIIGRCREELGDYEAARMAYIHSSKMVPSRLYPLSLLMNLYLKTGDGTAAAVCAEKILSMPWNPGNRNMLRIREQASAVIQGGSDI